MDSSVSVTDDLPPGWEIHRSTRHPEKVYYFNTDTAESSWEKPEVLKSIESRKKVVSGSDNAVSSLENKSGATNPIKRKLSSDEIADKDKDVSCAKRKTRIPSGDLNYCLKKIEKGVKPLETGKLSCNDKRKQASSSSDGSSPFATCVSDSDGKKTNRKGDDKDVLGKKEHKAIPCKENDSNKCGDVSPESRSLDLRLKFAKRRIKAGQSWKPGQCLLTSSESDSESLSSLSSLSNSPAKFSVTSLIPSPMKGPYTPNKLSPGRPGRMTLATATYGQNQNVTKTSSTNSFGVRYSTSPIANWTSEYERREPVKEVSDSKSASVSAKFIPRNVELSFAKVGKGKSPLQRLNSTRAIPKKSNSGNKSETLSRPPITDGVWVEQPCNSSCLPEPLQDIPVSKLPPLDEIPVKQFDDTTLPRFSLHKPDSTVDGVWVEQPSCSSGSFSPVSRSLTSVNMGHAIGVHSKEMQKLDTHTLIQEKSVAAHEPEEKLQLHGHFGAGSPKASSCGIESSQVTDMEVDDDEVLIMQNLQEVREVLPMEVMEVTGGLTEAFSQSIRHRRLSDEGGVFVVLDTNIFIQGVKYIHELKDHAFPVIGRPSLVIPWVVMQELDALKDNRRKNHSSVASTTQLKAVDAIKYLNKCFASGHPRIIGQTPVEGKQAVAGLEVECNDDRVLQCCAQWQLKFPKADVVLLSLDRNLRNKAMIMKISAFTTKNIADHLSKHINTLIPTDVMGPINPVKLTSVTESTSSVQENMSSVQIDEKAELADKIMCEMKTALQKTFSIVLESEMTAVYEELWLSVVYRKPPWTLSDLLECFKKHWIAVFGQILPRHLENVVESMRKGLLSDRYGRTIEEVSHLVEDGLEFCDHLKNHSSYGGAMDSALKVLKDLELQCRGGVQNEMHPGSANQNGGQSPVSQNIQEQFQLVWESIHNSSESIKSYFSGDDKQLIGAQRQSAVELFARFAIALTELHKTYSRMLEVDPEGSSNHTEFDETSSAINDFAEALSVQPWYSMEGTNLREFCLHEENRAKLHIGNTQLKNFILTLKACFDQLPEEEQALF